MADKDNNPAPDDKAKADADKPDPKDKKDPKAPAEDGKDKKTLSEGGDGKSGDDDKGAPEGEGEDGGDDWRVDLADGDEKTLGFLKRFTDQAALGRHIMALEKKVREKGGIQPPAADASAEDKAKFYTEHFGRPEKAEDIKIEPKLDEGEELSDDEAASLKGVSLLMHKAGVFGAEQMAAGQQIFADLAVGARKQMDAAVETFRNQATETLQKDWRRDYDANLNMAVGYMQMRCEQAGVDRAELANVRLANGALLGDHPLFLKVMALGGREHSEDPLMLRAEDGGAKLETLRDALKKEMEKRNGSNADKKYYESADGKARREKLRKDIKRM